MADLLNGAALPVPDWDSSFAFVLWVNKASQVPLACAPQKTFRQPYGRVSCYSGTALYISMRWERNRTLGMGTICCHTTVVRTPRSVSQRTGACLQNKRKKDQCNKNKSAALDWTEIARWVKVECCQWKLFRFINSLQSQKYIFLLCVFLLDLSLLVQCLFFSYFFVIISYRDLVLMWFVFSCC